MSMKRMVLLTLLLAAFHIMVIAQTKDKYSSSHRSAVKSKKATGKTRTDTVGRDNRVNYDWTNGQKATPTGQQATGSNSSGFATLKKDSSKVAQKGKKKHQPELK